MNAADHVPPVRVGQTADGFLAYLVEQPLEHLPAVRGRDIELAWDAARQGALSARWGAVRGFRFRRDDGGFTDLVLADRDARCWAAAVNATTGTTTAYGLSICLRLLALIDLLGSVHWAAGLLRLDRDGATLHPSVLRAAACTPLTPDARFNETRFRERLPPFTFGGRLATQAAFTGATT
jgi:hypothetical protein